MTQSTPSNSKATLKSILLVVLVAVSLCSFTISNAQTREDQFNVNLTVTTSAPDVTAPSVPANLVATAVSSNQINLSWNVSTDDVAVTGYKIYRDGTYLATTGGVSYSDSALTPSTLYSYTVSAIDAAANESAQSTPASATTFSVITTGGSSTGGSQLPGIYDVVVVPTQTGAVVYWKTNIPTRGTLSWGLTSSYETGAVSEILFGTEHQASISGLISGTQYFFDITVLNGHGRSNSNQGNFTTLALSQENPNASNFTAIAQEKTILLKWNNPESASFKEVRIMRSTEFFPTNPTDGEVVYEGNEEVNIDADVVPGTRYYYTLFAKDVSGDYSSGIVASARIQVPGEVLPPDEDIFGNLPPAPNVDPLINALTFFDFDFIQSGVRIGNLKGNESIEIDGTKDLTVSLDYRKVPEVLKTIAITLTHPTEKDRTFTFLLRVNKEKTLYTATIGPLGDSGIYKANISIVDFKNRGLKSIAGELVASAERVIQKSTFLSTIALIISEKIIHILLLLTLMLVFLKAIKQVLDGKKKSRGIIGKRNRVAINQIWQVDHDKQENSF